MVVKNSHVKNSLAVPFPTAVKCNEAISGHVSHHHHFTPPHAISRTNRAHPKIPLLLMQYNLTWRHELFCDQSIFSVSVMFLTSWKWCVFIAIAPTAHMCASLCPITAPYVGLTFYNSISQSYLVEYIGRAAQITVFIPRLAPAFSSPWQKRIDCMDVCPFGCRKVHGWSSASFRARKSSPRLAVAFCAVQARCPLIAQCTVAIYY